MLYFRTRGWRDNRPFQCLQFLKPLVLSTSKPPQVSALLYFMLILIVYILAAFDLSFSRLIYVYLGHAVTRLVESQGYKPEGRGFLILPAEK